MGRVTLALVAALFVAALGKAERTRGRVESVDVAAGRVTIKTHDDRELHLRVDDSTKFEQAGKPFSPASLQPGQRVRIAFESSTQGPRMLWLRARPLGADGERADGELLRKLRSLTFEQREKYREELEQVVEDIDDGIADLKRKAKLATAIAKPQIDRQIEEMKVKREALKARMDRVKTAGAAGWEDLKTGIQQAIDDLRRGLNEPTPPPPSPPPERLPPG